MSEAGYLQFFPPCFVLFGQRKTARKRAQRLTGTGEAGSCSPPPPAHTCDGAWKTLWTARARLQGSEAEGEPRARRGPNTLSFPNQRVVGQPLSSRALAVS